LSFVPVSSAQDAFDRVCEHLRTTPYGQAINDDGTCIYGKPDGPQCAIGCLMPPFSKTRKIIASFSDLVTNNTLFKGSEHLMGRSDASGNLLGVSLQTVHDQQDELNAAHSHNPSNSGPVAHLLAPNPFHPKFSSDGKVLRC
jgi:hypothetical protein